MARKYLILLLIFTFGAASAAFAANTESKYGDSKKTTPTPIPEPRTAEDYFKIAVDAFQSGDSRNAENYAKTAISLDSKNPEYHYLLGKIFMFRGAEKNRLEIRNFGVDSPETNYVKRYIHGRDELALAKSEFEIVTRLNPNIAEAWLNLGIAEDNLGNEDAGVEAYKNAIRMSPQTPIARDAYNNLGLLLQAEGKPEEALEAYQSALAIDPTFSPTRINLNKLTTANPKLKKLLKNK